MDASGADAIHAEETRPGLLTGALQRALIDTTTGSSTSSRARATRHTACATALLLALTLGRSTPARADEPSPADLAAARDLGTQGVLLAEAGKCKQAIEKLQRAAALYAAPTIVVPLGECQIKIGKIVAGTERLQRVVREPLADGAPKPFIEARQHAQDLLDKALPRIAKLVIHVKAPARARVEVAIDDTGVPSALLGAPRPTDPGTHRIVARAPGYRTAARRITLADGESKSVELVMHALPQSEMPSAPTSTRSTVGYVALGLGVAGVGVGSVLGVVALQKKRDLDAQCPGGHCSPAQAQDLANARNMGTASTISFGVGLAAAAAGVWLVLGDDGEARADTSARLWLGVGSAGVAGKF